MSGRFGHLRLRLLPNSKGFEGWGDTGDVALARSVVERLGFCLMALVSFRGSGWVVLIVGCFLQFGLASGVMVVNGGAWLAIGLLLSVRWVAEAGGSR